MSKERKQEGKARTPRMFYGVNAAAYLTLCEMQTRIKKYRGSADKQASTLTRGEIQNTFIHYLRFIRALTESDV